MSLEMMHGIISRPRWQLFVHWGKVAIERWCPGRMEGPVGENSLSSEMRGFCVRVPFGTKVDSTKDET
jgi:hypothetical protein